MPGFGFHPLYLLILLAIVLIIFGPGKLPELGGALGRGIREFRKQSDELKEEVNKAIEGQPSTTEATRSEPEPAKAEATEVKKSNK
jgi:TatA/E family protein of Tat protein translocase